MQKNVSNLPINNQKVIAIVKEKETEEADKALVLHELLTEKHYKMRPKLNLQINELALSYDRYIKEEIFKKEKGENTSIYKEEKINNEKMFERTSREKRRSEKGILDQKL